MRRPSSSSHSRRGGRKRRQHNHSRTRRLKASKYNLFGLKARRDSPSELGIRGRPAGQFVRADLNRITDECRQNVLEEVSNILSAAERDSIRDLNHPESANVQALARLRENWEGLVGSIRQTRSTTIAHQDTQAGELEPSASFELLGGIRDTIDYKRALLDAHWEKWANVQQKLLYLAVEILGPEGLSASANDRLVRKGIRHATSAFDRHAALTESLQERSKHQTKDIEILTTEVRKQLDTQEQRWQGARRRSGEQMLQLLKRITTRL